MSLQELNELVTGYFFNNQRTSACNTSSDMIKDLLGDDTGTVHTSLVCSGIATKDETCSPDSLVVGADFLSHQRSQ